MVQQASDTRPWNDNGARAYGPMTYRLTNLGASFAPNTGMPTYFEETPQNSAPSSTMVAG